MGYIRKGDISAPLLGRYYALGGTYHLTVEKYKMSGDIDQIFFMSNPSIFIYRDPRDILLSYYKDIITYPNNIQKYISKNKNIEEGYSLFLQSIIETGTFGENLLSYSRWLDFEKYNVMPVRFEDLFMLKEENSGINTIRQVEIIWRIQLRLMLDGKTLSFIDKLFSPKSPVFCKDKISNYELFYTKEHYRLFDKFNKKYGNLLKKFGYE